MDFFSVAIPAQPGGSWAVGREVLLQGKRFQIIRIWGLFHVEGLQEPQFISRGATDNHIPGEVSLPETSRSIICEECIPPCVGEVWYREVLEHFARAPD